MKKIFVVSILAIALLACNKVEDYRSSYGLLSMDLNVGTETKSALSPDDLLNTASVKIYKANNKGMIRSYTYSEMPSPFYLAADAYRVDVEAGEYVKDTPAPASWEQKSYKGSKEFTIIANQVTNVEVEAYVNNAVTRISFDQTVADNFEDGYTFTIGLSEESQLIYSAAKSGADGYFIVDGLRSPSFSWTFNGILTKDGSSFTKTGVITDVQPAKLYTMNLKYTIKDGDLHFTLLEDSTTDIFDDTIIFEPVSTGLASTPEYETWATKTKFYADVDQTENPGATVQFSYSPDKVSWETVDAVSDNDGAFYAEITGLAPSTTYTYKLLVDGEEAGEPKTITTDAAPNLPNASFEHYTEVTGYSFLKFYNPECTCTDEDGHYKFWASGNGDEESIPGSFGLPGKFKAITKIDAPGVNDDGEPEGNCVLAHSQEVLSTKLAAGNLFTGQFVTAPSTDGGIVNFGRPWTSRPTKLRVWCKYTTGVIDWGGGGNLPVEKNVDYDRAQIKVALGTWSSRTYGGSVESPVKVDTRDENTFVDFYEDSSTIANGDIIIYHDGYTINRGNKVDSNTGSWTYYDIPIVYRDHKTYPTHIIISCSASQYGDYFTGYSNSQLWLDNFELIYE